MIDDLTIELPVGWQVGSLPKDVDQNAKAAEYSREMENKNGNLHIRRELRCDLMMFQKRLTRPCGVFFFSFVRTQDDQQIVSTTWRSFREPLRFVCEFRSELRFWRPSL